MNPRRSAYGDKARLRAEDRAADRAAPVNLTSGGVSRPGTPRRARLYYWAFVLPATLIVVSFEQALLIRCTLDAPEGPKKLAYYLTFAPVGTLMETLLAVAGHCWTIEESLEAAKGEVGLNHYEKMRHDHGWYRHISLLMLMPAYLAVVRSQLPGNALKGELWWRSWPPTAA